MTEMNTNNARNVKIDLIRCIACIAVVAMHVISMFWYKVPVKLLPLTEYIKDIEIYKDTSEGVQYLSCEYMICSFIDAFTRFSVPIFVMISGALILNRPIIPNGYLWKKILHIGKIIVVWGSVLSFFTFLLRLMIHEPVPVSYLIQTAINGAGVFWFLYMILFLYIASPVFKVIANDNQTAKLFIVIWFFSTVCWNTLVSIVPALEENVKLEYMELFSIYTGYYIMGGYLYKFSSIGGG